MSDSDTDPASGSPTGESTTDPVCEPSGRRGGAAHLLAQIVRVRIDAHHVDIRRQHVAVLDDVVRLASGNVDRLLLELDADRRARGRRVGQEEPDHRAHRLTLCPRDHVQQQDEIGAGFERPRRVGRLHDRDLTGGPAIHVVHLVAVHRREPGTRIGAIEHARHAPDVDRQVRVVQHLRTIGAELDGADVARRGDRHRKDEVAEDVARSRLQRVGFGERQHEVGCAELPAAGEDRRFGRVGRIALGRTALDPLRDQGDLIVAEPPFVDERAVTRLGQPWGHRAPLHRRGNSARVATNRVVIEHAERCTRHADRIFGRA